MAEKIDVLVPPLFEKSGQVKDREVAYDDGNWIGTSNLWIFRNIDEPEMIFQLRSKNSRWAPNMLDVPSGGHIISGETPLNSILRESEEELGKKYSKKKLRLLGRKIFVGEDIKGREKKNIVYVYSVLDNSPINSYKLEENEVSALVACKVSDILKVYENRNHRFFASGINWKSEKIEMDVGAEHFIQNLDDYPFKMAWLGEKVLMGENVFV